MMSSFAERLERTLDALDRDATVALLADLVRIPSHPGVERQEEGVAQALAAHLERNGLETRLQEVAPGRPNLLCTLLAPRPGRHLVLCGHTDTVPLNDDDPGVGFSAEVRNGMLHGRGSVDMKGALAAMAATLIALHRSDGLSAGAVTLAAVVDEEMAGLGAEHFVHSGFRADGAVVGEPTENHPCLGHKGLEWLEIELRGRAAHGGTPEKGINAIAAAARFVELVGGDLAPRLRERSVPLLGPPTINFGTIRGGDQASTVAATCTLTVDRRLVPGETFGSVVAELEELLSRIERGMPGLVTSVRRLPGSLATLERHAFVTDSKEPLARAAARACKAVQGHEPTFGAFPAWTDGGLLARHGGIPTVILGPGDLAAAHSPGEAIPVAEMHEAARLYTAIALDFTSAEAT